MVSARSRSRKGRVLHLEPPAANTHPHVFQPTRPTGCQGFDKRTQKQYDWELPPSSRYCGHHTEQEGKCRAIVREEGRRCNKRICKAGRGFFCNSHKDWATPKEVRCAGYMVGNKKEPCYRRVSIPDYPYCMVQHDSRVIYCDPKEFRQANLRDRMFELIRTRDGDHDPYNAGQMIMDSAAFHLEHIGEAQIAAFMCQLKIFQDTEERDDIVEFYRDEVVNAMPNLCITSKDTNKKKGKATTNALGEMMIYSLKTYDQPDVRALDDICATAFNVPIVKSFNDHLCGEKLSRNSTKAIRRETGQALQRWKNAFLDHGETPIYEEFGRQTQKVYTAFDLHVVD
ncbi:hypothetical protein L914_14733 [Phytophthora nicotianae]|uniref:Uncharacterized protein n=1 Tax=Phytophthora nicotianae TaxID=4792 RepID=W2MU99_PHYNI|nr:hypothetical protein L914_14733 [Phytophthora nicotianae]